MESRLIEGERPVTKNQATLGGILSNAMHVKLRVKLRRPRRKAKYVSATDSEPVPRGKGEKNPGEGSEIDLKPCAYKVSEPERVMACLLLNESASYCLWQV